MSLVDCDVDALIQERDRLLSENEAFDDGLRELAFRLSAGGYNAVTLTGAQLLDKVNWGVDNIQTLAAGLVDRLTQERAELYLQVGAMRDLLQSFVAGQGDDSVEGAKNLLALLKGETKRHTIVPDDRLQGLQSQNRLLLASAEAHGKELQDEREHTTHYIGRVGQQVWELLKLTDAAKGVLDNTEAAHRPPVRDEIETGRMVLVRLHALAELQDILNTLEQARA